MQIHDNCALMLQIHPHASDFFLQDQIPDLRLIKTVEFIKNLLSVLAWNRGTRHKLDQPLLILSESALDDLVRSFANRSIQEEKYDASWLLTFDQFFHKIPQE